MLCFYLIQSPIALTFFGEGTLYMLYMVSIHAYNEQIECFSLK